MNKKHRQSIYFDADVLINYFERGFERGKSKDVGQNAREVISKATNMRNDLGMIINVPLIVLGELTMKSMENKEIDLPKLLQLLRDKLDAKFTSPGKGKESFEIAHKLMKEDPQLDAADSLLVAQALTDKTSEWLITTDSKLTYNRIIEEKKEELGSKLKISDRFKQKGEV